MHRTPVPKPTISKRHLPRRLRKLIGRWIVEGQFVGGHEAMDVRGSVTCTWLVKDALAVWRERSTVAPKTISVMGADDNQNAFTILHSDERGVVRRLKMALTARRWTWVRRVPGFSQRLVGRIAPNGRVIRVTCDKSADGRHWMRDFNLTYKKR